MFFDTVLTKYYISVRPLKRMTKFNIDVATPGSLWQFQMSRELVMGSSPINLYLDEGMHIRLIQPESWSLQESKHFVRIYLGDYLLLLPGKQKVGPLAHAKFLHLNSQKVGWIELRGSKELLVKVVNKVEDNEHDKSNTRA